MLGEQPGCPRCRSWPHGPTHLLHLLLVAIGADALEGLLSVVGVPALLLIGLLGLGVGRQDLGGLHSPTLPPPPLSLNNPCQRAGRGVKRSHPGQGLRSQDLGWRQEGGQPCVAPHPRDSVA